MSAWVTRSALSANRGGRDVADKYTNSPLLGDFMATPKPMTSSQKPGGKGGSAAQHTAVGGGSRPDAACKYKTETSAPKNAQKLRG
jgi:hypothetical protein